MPPVDPERRINELERRLAELEQSSRANFGQVAVAIRRSRSQVVQNELQRSIRRLAPSVAPIDWVPRIGEHNTPALADSLLDRLRRGETVADTLGNVAPSFGQTNVLRDPLIEVAPTLHNLGGGYGIGEDRAWYIEYTLNSGTLPTQAVSLAYLRTDGDNPYNSSVVQLQAVFGAAGNVTYLMRPETGSGVGFVGLDSLPLPYLVAAGRVGEFGAASTLTNLTVTITIQIYNEDTSSVVAESEPVLLSDLVALKPAHTQLVTAIQGAAATFQADTWRWRLKIDMVATGAGGTARVKIGEPQLHYAYNPDAAPFSPQLARWRSTYLAEDLEVGEPLEQDGSGVLVRRAGSIEVVADAGVPYIDFKNESTDDFDGRIGLLDDDTLQVQGANWSLTRRLELEGDISPAQITANQNNYTPSGLATAHILRLTTDATPRTITGIAAPSGGQQSTLILVNANTGTDITLAHASGSSSAVNRIFCPGSANLTLRANGAVWLWYDTTSDVWRVLSP